MKNKVHKINGFVYVTSEEKPKEKQYGIGYAVGIRYVGAEHYLFFHDGSSRGKINAVCEHASTVILTNDNALIDVQKLTPQEVEYLNTVDECEVEHIGYVNAYNISIPKQDSKYDINTCKNFDQEVGCDLDDCNCEKQEILSNAKERAKQETIEEVANRYSGYHKSYMDKTDIKGSAFLDGYNQALKTLYTEEEVFLIIEKFRDLKMIAFSEWFNQNKKK